MRAFPLLIFSRSNFLNLTFCTKIITHKHVITLFTFYELSFTVYFMNISNSTHSTNSTQYTLYSAVRSKAQYLDFFLLLLFYNCFLLLSQLFWCAINLCVCFPQVLSFRVCIIRVCVGFGSQKENQTIFILFQEEKNKENTKKRKTNKKKGQPGRSVAGFPLFFSRFEPRHISARASETCDGPIFQLRTSKTLSGEKVE